MAGTLTGRMSGKVFSILGKKKMAAVRKSKRLKMKKLLVALILIRRIRRKKKKRSMWVRPWISRRKEQGAFHNLVREQHTDRVFRSKVQPEGLRFLWSRKTLHLWPPFWIAFRTCHVLWEGKWANHHVLGKRPMIGLSTENLFLHPAHKRFSVFSRRRQKIIFSMPDIFFSRQRQKSQSLATKIASLR